MKVSLLLLQADQSMVGFIGVGNMGCHMARNLLKKGYPLLVYDVLQENMDVMKKAGNLSRVWNLQYFINQMLNVWVSLYKN